MTVTSLKEKLFRTKSEGPIRKPHDDDASCATVPIDESWRSTAIDESWRSTASDATSFHERSTRRSSLKGSNTVPITPRPRRGSISFCEDVQVTPIVPTTKLIKKKSELWLRTKDYERIIARSITIVDQAEEGGSETCTRGLENLMQDTSARYDAWDAVLDVQHAQRENGVLNDEELSKIYKLSCANSRTEAKLRGLQDEKDAMQYLRAT